MDPLDSLKAIDNPLLRDWSIVISLAGIGLFFALRWLVGIIHDARKSADDGRHSEASRIETFLQGELSLSRQERKELAAAIEKMQAEKLELRTETSRQKIQLRHIVMRVRYLERLLLEHHIQFIPAIENYDDV